MRGSREWLGELTVVERIYELPDQSFDPESVSHIVSWVVPLPTFLPVEEWSTFSFEADQRDRPRTMIRLFSAEVSLPGYEETWELTEVAERLFRGSLPEHHTEARETFKPVVRRTFAEIAGFIDFRGLEDEQANAVMSLTFDTGLELIREIQNSVFDIDHVARPLITLQSLPQIVPQFVQEVAEEFPSSMQMSAYIIPSVLSSQTHWFKPAWVGERA